MLEKIIELHKSGQLDGAESGYRELLQFNPDDPEVLHLLGILRRQRNDFQDGMTLVGRAIELAPERANFHMTLGGMRMHAQLWDAAYESFSTAIRLNPNLTSAYSALGQIAMQRGDAAAAESHFTVALKATEDDPQVLTSLGNLYMSRGDSGQALKYLTRAVELRPNDAAAQASVGRAFYARGMISFAETALSNALKLQPDFAVARLLLGEIHLKAGQHVQAQLCFTTLVESGKQLAPAQAGLGDIARARGDYSAAVRHYRASLAVQSKQTEVVLSLGWCLQRLGQIDEALSLYNEALAAMPGQTELCLALTGLLAKLNLPQQVMEVWRECLAAQPNNDAARAEFALSLESAGQWDAALEQAESVTAVRPDIGLLLARAALRKGVNDQALQHLQAFDVTSLTPMQRQLHWHYLGITLDRQGQYESAVNAWHAAHREHKTPNQLPRLAALTHALREDIIARMKAEQTGERKNIGEEWADQQPVLLIGAPGSGVDRIAAMLSDQPSLAVLRDRFGPNARHDAFVEQPDFDLYDLEADGARRFLRHYRRALDRLAITRDRRVVDWLPYFDARFLPVLQAALPSMKWIVVQRDPHDSLLNWLSYGWAAGYELSDLSAGAQWLALTRQHEKLATTVGSWERLVITNEKPLVETQQELQRFLGLPQMVEGPGTRKIAHGAGGLPNALPNGHWQVYEPALAEVFVHLNHALD